MTDKSNRAILMSEVHNTHEFINYHLLIKIDLFYHGLSEVVWLVAFTSHLRYNYNETTHLG